RRLVDRMVEAATVLREAARVERLGGAVSARLQDRVAGSEGMPCPVGHPGPEHPGAIKVWPASRDVPGRGQRAHVPRPEPAVDEYPHAVEGNECCDHRGGSAAPDDADREPEAKREEDVRQRRDAFEVEVRGFETPPDTIERHAVPRDEEGEEAAGREGRRD